jgi:hypothetical protein
MKKICSKCSVEKDLCEFHNFVHSKDGKKSICKICISEKNKTPEEKLKENKRRYEWVKNNKEKILKYRKTSYEKHKNSILKKNKEWKLKNIEQYKKISKEYREQNKEKLKNLKKEYREKNRDKVLNLTREWVKKNQESHQKKKKEYRESEQGLLKKRENYHKNKNNNKHIIIWRTILNNTFKRIGTKKQDKTIELLGYSAIELKEHIEKLFVEGMSWENHGEWHIDHIKPVSKFDKTEKISIINSLDNLQPLWAVDNLKKSNKIIN